MRNHRGMETEFPTGTLTFLMTDVEGSTRLWEQFPQAMPKALARHNQIIQQCVQQNGGALVKSRGEGDSTFSVFPQAMAALDAATAMQQAFAQEKWPAETPLRVRAALHTGQAALTEDDYHSVDVNRCARLRGLASSGQTLLSQTTYQLVQDALQENVRVKPLGAHPLRDLTRPEEVFQLLPAGLPDDFPPLSSAGRFSTNLPHPLTRFIGRSREMAEIGRLLGEGRLLTLCGPGGAGKTRLAIQTGAQMQAQFQDGIWLVELAALADPSLIAQEIAKTVGVREEPGQPIADTLTGFLKTKTLLFLLDNCEHLLDGCARIAERVLRDCPKVRLLATSREPLGVAGETTWLVPPLSLPKASEASALERLGQYESVQLLLDRAAAVQPKFVLSRGNAPAVVQICRRLDGSPLALELAAARVRALSVDQIAERMNDRFRLLTGGSRTALPRQQTLRAVIDWSYDLLTEQERLLLHRLSVFSGGWMLEAAEAVCAGDGLAAEDVLDLLSQLVSKSLVSVEEAQTGAHRFFLLESLREYSAEKLENSQDCGSAISAQALAYFLALGEEAERRLDGPQEAAWLDRLEREQDNVRTSLEWAREHDPEACLRLAGAVYWFWFVRGYQSEGRGWLETALARGAEVAPEIRVKAINGAGILAWSQGDLEAAQARYEEALALQRARGDTTGVATLLNNLAGLACDRDDLASARALYSESLAVYRALNARGNVAKLLSNLGRLAILESDFTESASLLQESLTLCRELGHLSDTAVALENLGDLETRRGNLAQSRRYFLESVALFQTLGDKSNLARIVHSLGFLALAEENYSRCCHCLGCAETLRREIGLNLSPLDQSELEAAIGLLDQAFGEASRREAWLAGTKASLTETLSLMQQ